MVGIRGFSSGGFSKPPQHADLMVLGGLNEGVAGLPAPDPWLAPIRANLGFRASTFEPGLPRMISRARSERRACSSPAPVGQPLGDDRFTLLAAASGDDRWIGA
jgi:hypothetical protein